MENLDKRRMMWRKKVGAGEGKKEGQGQCQEWAHDF